MFKNKDALVAAVTQAVSATQAAKLTLAEREAEREAVRRQMKTAAQAEDFKTAAIFKEKLDSFDAPILELERQLTSTVEQQAELLEAARVWTFEQPEMKKADVQTLTRVRIVDPLTGHADTAYYSDSADTIQLHVKGKHFCSEAYHLSDWAGENRLLLEKTVRTINFGQQ